MSDDRLFASNNAIGRKWYFLNLIILTILIIVTEFIFKKYIIPHTTTEVYKQIAYGMLYLAYLFYAITFFALIDRRLYDITGDRNSNVYKNTAGVMKLIVLLNLIVIFFEHFSVKLPVSYETQWLIIAVSNTIFIIMTLILGLFKGKISNLSYEEYKKKIKYLNL